MMKSGPPKDWEPCEVWQALTERPCPSVVVEMPVRSYRGQTIPKIRIRVLRKDEQVEARIASRRAVMSRLELEKLDDSDPVVRELLADTFGIEILAKAVTTVEPLNPDSGKDPVYGRIFRNSDDVRRVLHDDEIVVLWAQYQTVQLERGPLFSGLIESEVDDWVRVLTEAAATYPLARLTWPMLAELCLCLARRVSSGPSPDSRQSLESLDGQGASLDTSPTGISYSTEQQEPGGPSLATPDTAAAIAKLLTDR